MRYFGGDFHCIFDDLTVIAHLKRHLEYLIFISQQQLEEEAKKPPEEHPETPEPQTETRNLCIAQIIYGENKVSSQSHLIHFL